MQEINIQYERRSQKDYSLSFKLAVVREVESGTIGNRAACVNIAFKVSVPLNGGENKVSLTWKTIRKSK